MPAPTVADVRNLPNVKPGWPEYTDAYVLAEIERSMRLYSAMTSAEDYHEIVLLHTAMELTGDATEDGGENAEQGPVSSASAGGVSMSLAVAVEAVAIDAIERNRWGRRLKKLLRANGPYSRVGTILGSFRRN